MRHNYRLAIFGLALLIGSCSGDDESLITEEKNFFVNISIGDSSYSISEKNYQLQQEGLNLACGSNYVDGQLATDKYIHGARPTVLNDTTHLKVIESVRFSVSQKIYRDELSRTDELGYLDQVLNSDKFGFPVLNEGYFEVFDFEKPEFVVNRDERAEAYLIITTRDEQIFTSSTAGAPNERSDEAFFAIDAIKKQDTTVSEYPYVIEGRFKVDLFEGHYGSTFQMAEGSFRLPVFKVTNSEIFGLCNDE